MRTLRRSCDACAKAKHACDLRTPQCTRCLKRKASCTYANEPLTSSLNEQTQLVRTSRNGGSPALRGGETSSRSSPDGHSVNAYFHDTVQLSRAVDAAWDPFDSYPATRLPRTHVQQLIHHFLSDIAFQYYPLDLNATSNPFVTSWWPLALADPALFHVSLQTASLDKELKAQKGFFTSEMLMMDSVALVRRKVADSNVAFKDETLNSVVTLAAIEYGKGNMNTSRMHIDGVTKMIQVRGGIQQIKQSSPLTARMVAWVSMLVMEAPQFQIQDDAGNGDGIGPISQWQQAALASMSSEDAVILEGLDATILDVLVRLRLVFQQAPFASLTGAELHDLTCYVVHRLLLMPPLLRQDSGESTSSECLRLAVALFMLLLHGTTYYSHAALANKLLQQLKTHLERLSQLKHGYDSLDTWLFSVGMASSMSPADGQWFAQRAGEVAQSLGIKTWDQALVHLRSVVWVDCQQAEIIRQRWEAITANG